MLAVVVSLNQLLLLQSGCFTNQMAFWLVLRYRRACEVSGEDLGFNLVPLLLDSAKFCSLQFICLTHSNLVKRSCKCLCKSMLYSQLETQRKIYIAACENIVKALLVLKCRVTFLFFELSCEILCERNLLFIVFRKLEVIRY
jgi:hypothetical protein